MTTTFDAIRAIIVQRLRAAARAAAARHAARGDRARFARDHRAHLPARGRVQDHGRQHDPAFQDAWRHLGLHRAARRGARRQAEPCAETRRGKAKRAAAKAKPASATKHAAPRAAGTNDAGVAKPAAGTKRAAGAKRAPRERRQRRPASASARALAAARARGEARRRHGARDRRAGRQRSGRVLREPRAGRSSIGVLPDDAERAPRDAVAAPRGSSTRRAHFPAPRLRMLDRVSQLALVAAKQAIASAGIEWTDEERASIRRVLRHRDGRRARPPTKATRRSIRTARTASSRTPCCSR